MADYDRGTIYAYYSDVEALKGRVEKLEEALKPKESLGALAKPKPVTRGYNEADDSYTLPYEAYLQLQKEVDALRDQNARLKERLQGITSLVREDDVEEW